MCNAYASHHVCRSLALASAPIVRALPSTRLTSALMRVKKSKPPSRAAQEAAVDSSVSRSPCSAHFIGHTEREKFAKVHALHEITRYCWLQSQRQTIRCWLFFFFVRKKDALKYT